MGRRSSKLEPVEVPEIPPLEGKSLRGYKVAIDDDIRREIEEHQKNMQSKKLTDERAKTVHSGTYSGGNTKKQIAGEKTVEAIEKGQIEVLHAKAPGAIEDDPELKELFNSLAPDDYDLGISANRIERARLVCRALDGYNREEKQLLVYPVIYQMHLYGYHRAEIAAILGIKPATVALYINDCRVVYKDELIKEYTSEDRVAESLFLYDFVKKEALRKASKASDDRAAAYLRLAAQVETERNKLLETTGYFEKVRRANIIEATEDQDINTLKRNSLVADIREVFTAHVSESDD